MIKKTVILVLGLTICLSVLSQGNKDKVLKEASEFFAFKNYPMALPFYLEYYNKYDTVNSTVNFRIGECRRVVLFY